MTTRQALAVAKLLLIGAALSARTSSAEAPVLEPLGVAMYKEFAERRAAQWAAQQRALELQRLRSFNTQDDQPRAAGAFAARLSVVTRQLQQHSGRAFRVVGNKAATWTRPVAEDVIPLDFSVAAESDAMVAFRVAREWGHRVLGHSLHYSMGFMVASTPDENAAADAYAFKFLAAFGYDVAAVAFHPNQSAGANGRANANDSARDRVVLAAARSQGVQE